MRIPRILTTSLTAAGLAIFVSLGCTAARASTVSFTYDLNGGLTGAPIFTGTSLILDGLATGSFTSGNAALDAMWDPVSLHTHDELSFATAQSIGVFTFTFKDGDTLFGNFFEDDSAVIATNTGPYTEMFKITGGTGAFAGAIGSASGGGVVGDTGYTAKGSGTVTAAGLAPVPEPGSLALVFEGLGLVAMAAGRKLVRQRV